MEGTISIQILQTICGTAMFAAPFRFGVFIAGVAHAYKHLSLHDVEPVLRVTKATKYYSWECDT